MTQVQTHQLDSLCEMESGLTPWELDFVCNLDENWRDRDLSDKQADLLERIYDQRV